MAALDGTLLRSADRRSAPRRGLWREHPALMVALTYGVVGIIYIALSDQVVSYLVQHDSARITAIQTWKGWAWIVLTTFLIFFLVTHSINEVRAAQRETPAIDTRFRTMIETTNEGVVVADADNRCQYVNQTMATMLGTSVEELVGTRCGECVHESHRPIVEQALSERASNEPQRFDCQFRRKDGSSLWTIVSSSPILDESTGRRTATLFMITDITARKAAEAALEKNLEAQRLLLNELDHRVRNNLSSLSSLLDLSKSATSDVVEFATMMSGRIQAMAKAHALAARAGNDGQDLARVIAEMIPHPARSRVSVDGPHVGVPGASIVSLAMLIHEMTWRSLRQGALGHATGRVEISWRADEHRDAGHFAQVRWCETPAIETSALDDQTDQLIAGLVQRDFGGSIATSRGPDSIVHDMRLNLNLSIREAAIR